jgi:hypothetical protein
VLGAVDVDEVREIVVVGVAVELQPFLHDEPPGVD